VRIVFDTIVPARAHQLARGLARQVLLYVVAGSDVLIPSQYLLQELERILAHPRLLKRFTLKPFDISAYLEYLARASALVDPLPVPEDVLRDGTDNPVLGTALAAKADDVICTRDADFFAENVQLFSAAQGIQILTDLELMRSLRTQP
jgi:putative PIN family toxin of toxin-antitoxin system